VIAVMHGEWVKLRTVRSPGVMVGLSLVLTWLIAGLSAGAHEDFDDPLLSLAGSAVLMAVLMLVLGVQLVAQEYRFGTIRTTFTAVPNRARVLAAKVLVGAAVGGATALASFVGALIAVQIVLTNRGYDLPMDGRVLDTAVGFVVVGALAVMFGIGVGAITRNPAFGIAVVLVVLFVLEPLIPVLTIEELAPWLPFTALGGSIPHHADGTQVFTPWYVSACVFGGWTALLLVVGGLLVDRRDA
jgi:ABC-2 type transport system permease protein